MTFLGKVNSQNVTYYMVKVTIDSLLVHDSLGLNWGDYLAIDISDLNLSKTVHDSIIKYVHNIHTNVIETTFNELIKRDTSWDKLGYLNGFFISVSMDGCYAAINDSFNYTLFFGKIYSGEGGFDGWANFSKVDDKWALTNFFIFNYY